MRYQMIMIVTPAHAPALFAAITAEASLRAGWRRVRRNGGGAGGDGQTPWQFNRQLDRNIASLSRDLGSDRKVRSSKGSSVHSQGPDTQTAELGRSM